MPRELSPHLTWLLLVRSSLSTYSRCLAQHTSPCAPGDIPATCCKRSTSSRCTLRTDSDCTRLASTHAPGLGDAEPANGEEQRVSSILRFSTDTSVCSVPNVSPRVSALTPRRPPNSGTLVCKQMIASGGGKFFSNNFVGQGPNPGFGAWRLGAWPARLQARCVHFGAQP